MNALNVDDTTKLEKRWVLTFMDGEENSNSGEEEKPKPDDKKKSIESKKDEKKEKTSNSVLKEPKSVGNL